MLIVESFKESQIVEDGVEEVDLALQLDIGCLDLRVQLRLRIVRSSRCRCISFITAYKHSLVDLFKLGLLPTEVVAGCLDDRG